MGIGRRHPTWKGFMMDKWDLMGYGLALGFLLHWWMSIRYARGNSVLDYSIGYSQAQIDMFIQYRRTGEISQIPTDTKNQRIEEFKGLFPNG